MNDKKNLKNTLRQVKRIQNILIFDVKNKIEQTIENKNNLCLQKFKDYDDKTHECLMKNHVLLHQITNEFLHKFDGINTDYSNCIEKIENSENLENCSKDLKKNLQKEMLIYVNNIDFKNY